MHFATRLGLNQPCRAPVAADDRHALLRKIATLEARVAELELALKMALSASATVPPGAKPSATPENKNTSTDITAKLKDEPWKAAGVSRRTYYRRKAAGTL